MATAIRGNLSGISREATIEAGAKGPTNQRKFRRPTTGCVLTFMWQPQGPLSNSVSASEYGYLKLLEHLMKGSPNRKVCL